MSDSREIERIIRRGGKVSGNFLFIRFFPNQLKNIRVAVVAGLKVHKKAVYRNKLRRRVREGLRQNLHQIKPGYDLVFFIKPQAMEADFKGLEAEILSLLGKARLLERQ